MEFTQQFDKTYSQFGNYQIKGTVTIDADTKKIKAIMTNQIIKDEVMVMGVLTYSDYRIAVECQFEKASDRLLLYQAIEQYISDIENELAMVYTVNVEKITAIQKEAKLRRVELNAAKAAVETEIAQAKSDVVKQETVKA